mgnify:CR=1 FL=1
MGNETNPAVKTVPESELLAIKGSLTRKLDDLNQEIAQRDTRIKELETELAQGATELSQQEVLELKRKIYAEGQSQRQERRKLEQQAKELSDKETTILVSSIAREFSVDAAELGQFTLEPLGILPPFLDKAS